MSPIVWDILEPILQANNGWALWISTPRGTNHFYKLYNYAKEDKDWFAERLTIEDTAKEDGSPIVTKEQIEGERKRGKAENIIQQEYYCSWEAPISGAFYAEAISLAEKENRITDVPYDPALPVYTAWDLGIRDLTVVIFFQPDRSGSIRVIDCYANSGEGIPHYAKKLDSLPYNYAFHYAPHDMAQREVGSGRTRLAIARSQGINFRLAPLTRIEDGIEAVRSILPLCYFDAKKCSRLIEALKTYRKEWDEDNQTFRASPIHDWSSHYADAFRYFAVSYRKNNTQTRQETAEAFACL
jgi:hypothetical protein